MYGREWWRWLRPMRAIEQAGDNAAADYDLVPDAQMKRK